MTLLHPWWLVPALLFLAGFLLLSKNRSNGWQRVINNSVLRFLMGKNNQSSRWHPGFLFAAITCVALSGPSIQAGDGQTYRHTQGWIVLADVSRSMTLEDVTPSRLSAMRDAALNLVANAQANATTLIIYAGDAFIVAPPSFDTANFINNINLLEYGTVPVDGSNVTRALALALSVIEGTNLINSRIFVLSDTGGFNTNANNAVSRLAQMGHRTDLILFGSDASDNTAVSFDLDSAQTMAKSGGGEWVIADAIGNVNFAKLDLQARSFDNNLLAQSGITTLQWRSLSHWILLLCIPPLLLLFRQGYL